MKTSKVLILMIALSLINVSAFAERRIEEPEYLSGEQRDEIRKKIDAIRIWRMTEALKLDAEASAKLSAALSPIEQKRRKMIDARVETMKALRIGLKQQKPDETAIKHLLDKLEDIQRRIQELKSEEFRSMRTILTIEQQARYVIFQQEFQREIRRMIGEARRGGRRAEGKNSGSGPAGAKTGP